MNLENTLMLRELYQLLQKGIIADDDFNIKKAEFLAKKINISAHNKIKLLKELHQLRQEGILTEVEFKIKKAEYIAEDDNIVESNNTKLHQDLHQLAKEGIISEEEYKIKKELFTKQTTDQIIDIQKIIKAGKSLKVVLVVSVLFPLISTIGFFLVQSNVKSAENLQLWIIIFGVFSLLGYVVIISNFYNAADYLENPLKKKKG